MQKQKIKDVCWIPESENGCMRNESGRQIICHNHGKRLTLQQYITKDQNETQ